MILNNYCNVRTQLVSLRVPRISIGCFCAILYESAYDVFTGNFIYTGQLSRGELFLRALESERLVRRLERPTHCIDADEANGRRWDPHARLGRSFRDMLVKLKYAEGSLLAGMADESSQ